MDQPITLNFDGGSRGNPGPAGIGIVLYAGTVPIFTLGRFIGRATNNVAEYKALIVGLEEARKLGAKKILIRGDSELIIKQMRGEYRVKNPDLRQLYEQAQKLFREFEQAKFEHNLRGKNAVADKLANMAMDRRVDVSEEGSGEGAVEAPLDSVDTPSAVAPEAGDRFHCARCGCEIQLHRPSSIRPHQLKPFVCQCGNKMGEAENTRDE